MYRKQSLLRLPVILGILGLATLAGCDLNGDSTETFSEEEVIEMAAADLASEGGEMATLDDISSSPPTTGTFALTTSRDGTYVDWERSYSLSIAEVPIDSDDYTIDGSVTGWADRPRIDSTFSSNTALTAAGWNGADTFTVNGTVSRSGTIDYESLVRDATRATQSEVTYTYENVVFNDDSNPPTAQGGTLRAQGSFVHVADRVLGTRRIEWSGTVVFVFAPDGTAMASVEGSNASYTVNLYLGDADDDDLVTE
jgi:hypothetical protein